MGNRVAKEMVVPKKLHGSVYNDGWFGSGAAWTSDESRIAYVAEVIAQCLKSFCHHCASLLSDLPGFNPPRHCEMHSV